MALQEANITGKTEQRPSMMSQHDHKTQSLHRAMMQDEDEQKKRLVGHENRLRVDG